MDRVFSLDLGLNSKYFRAGSTVSKIAMMVHFLREPVTVVKYFEIDEPPTGFVLTFKTLFCEQ